MANKDTVDWVLGFGAFLWPAVILWMGYRTRGRARRCPQCNRAHLNAVSFCTGCGLQFQESAERLSAPSDAAEILRRVYRVLFIYFGGFLALLLMPLLVPNFPIEMLRWLAGFYAVLGAGYMVYFYYRVSRCSACNRLVQLGENKEFSTIYCAHCGNLVNKNLR